jgi:asparagine synthetase B (glutamine-hydrolysing)
MDTPGIGSNTQAIDYAKEEVGRLQVDYHNHVVTIETLEVEADDIPDVIPDTATKETVVDLIKRMRDSVKAIKGLHELEKMPHLRRGQGADQFFFGLLDRVMRRDKKNNPGAGDTLLEKLTAYDVRILAEENERRRLAAEEAARVLAARVAEENRLAAEAEAARLAAERARKPETTAAKEEVAIQAETVASAARVETAVAAAVAEDAYVATLARPADIMRTRTASGSLSTMGTEKYSEIEKQDLLDKNKLWPYISIAEKQKALNAWAKANNYAEPMAGAKIGSRPRSGVR